MYPYKLKVMHENNFPNSHFFDTDTLKFFGERFSEMYVLKNTTEIKDYSGKNHTCYILSSYQRKAPKGCCKRKYHYFDVNTFELVD